jgi:MFS family permease
MNQPIPDNAPWWRHLTAYHWFVFLVASGAWFFDCVDQRLFSLARIPALTQLSDPSATASDIAATGKVVTAIFLIGWGVGGIIFGAWGDRYGRARMLTVTIIMYSIGTGLNSFSQGIIDFSILRFITGVGIGGVFGLAVALIVETVPEKSRLGALGMLQILSVVGNICAPLIKMAVDALEFSGVIAAGSGWRWMFGVGAIPALLVIPLIGKLREPEPWLKLKAEGKITGGMFSTYGDLLRSRRWRLNLLVGAVLATTGIIGLWGIGEYAVDIQKNIFKSHYVAAGLSGGELSKAIGDSITYANILQQAGGALGMWLFVLMASHWGRRPAFAIGFIAAGTVTALVYWRMASPLDAYWMMPLMGMCQLGIFAGFSIYLPELFPGRLRGTGTSFCYNIGRFAAAAGSFGSAALATGLYGEYGSPLSERYSAMTMCIIFFLGLMILPFAPETRGKPLPEEDTPEK